MVNETPTKKASDVVFQEGKKVSWILSTNPSENEQKFKNLLDENHIRYRFQKVFFKAIEGTRKTAECYYIAQFWLPRKKLFIEIPTGNRYRMPKIQDFRNYNALEVFPKAQCIKLTEEDLITSEFINDFIKLIK